MLTRIVFDRLYETRKQTGYHDQKCARHHHSGDTEGDDLFPAKVFKTYWYGLQLPIHLIAFTPESITKMLKSAGFDVKKIFYDRRGATLRLSLLNLKEGKYRFLSKLSRFKTSIKMTDDYIYKNCLKIYPFINLYI